MLTRDNCAHNKQWHKRAGGNAWDTQKPLGAHGINTRRCVLIDNSLHKVLPSEEGCALIVPEWVRRQAGGREENADAVVEGRVPALRVLFTLLRARFHGVPAAALDTIAQLPTVRDQLAKVRAILLGPVASVSVPHPLLEWHTCPAPGSGCSCVPDICTLASTSAIVKRHDVPCRLITWTSARRCYMY